MKVTEEVIQGVLMRWLMSEKRHELVLPNSNTFFRWEADVISVTRARLSHEYEVKVSMTDYKRDAKKNKHWFMKSYGDGPSYFWYVTSDFIIEPPEHAGWMNVHKNERGTWIVDECKPAPRLNEKKVTDAKMIAAGRLLSWRISNIYGNRIKVDAA